MHPLARIRSARRSAGSRLRRKAIPGTTSRKSSTMRPLELCIQYRSESGACKIAATDVAKSDRACDQGQKICYAYCMDQNC